MNSGSLSQAVQFVIASVAMCLFCSLLFFSLGFLCHSYCQRKRHPVMDLRSPMYQLQEVNVLQQTQSDHEQIEIKENEAYGPLNHR